MCLSMKILAAFRTLAGSKLGGSAEGPVYEPRPSTSPVDSVPLRRTFWLLPPLVLLRRCSRWLRVLPQNGKVVQSCAGGHHCHGGFFLQL